MAGGHGCTRTAPGGSRHRRDVTARPMPPGARCRASVQGLHLAEAFLLQEQETLLVLATV